MALNTSLESQEEAVNSAASCGVSPTCGTPGHHSQPIAINIQCSCAGKTEKPSGSDKYDLCEFYYFRHPKLRPGFQLAQGDLIANAAELYPEAWAYLQSEDGQILCKTEEAWQAMSTVTWATLADGTTVGWNGIGGAPFYAPDISTGALRLPDLRGMYAEAVGFDSLDVGGVHGDASRRVASLSPNGAGMVYGAPGNNKPDCALYVGAMGPNLMGSGGYPFSFLMYDSARVVPTANKNQPRAWGSLACVYLGLPNSPE